MKKTIWTLTLLLASITSTPTQAYQRTPAEQKAVTEAEAKIDRLKAEGMKKHPDQQPGEALRREAVEETTKSLNAQTDQKKKLADAAANFLGFFMINAQSRKEFCQKQGVDIAPFVNAFTEGHAAELTRARAILSWPAAEEDRMYSLIAPKFSEMVIQDMGDIARSGNRSVKEVCELFAAQGVELAARMHISKRQPTIYSVLTTGR
jgi:hypothetical protein